jgi:hypothetical protein
MTKVLEDNCLVQYRTIRKSDDDVYRYRLDIFSWNRTAGNSPRQLLAVINRPFQPEFATPAEADNTEGSEELNRLRERAARGGFCRLVVCSLFAARRPDTADQVGPENDAEILRAARDADMILACWGPQAGDGRRRADAVTGLLQPFTVHHLAGDSGGAHAQPPRVDQVDPRCPPSIWWEA